MSDVCFLIVGLGNPGEKYFLSRHNIGYELVDELVNKYFVRFTFYKKYSSYIGVYGFVGSKVVLVRSICYMNQSGVFVSEILKAYNICIENVIVVHDEVDIPFGFLKICDGGYSSHNGVRSFIRHVGTNRFIRLRVGIGHPINFASMTEHVLGVFSDCEIELLNRFISEFLLVINSIICFGINISMNVFNGKIRRDLKLNV